MASNTTFFCSNGGLWVTCEENETGACAFGPAGIARPATLQEGGLVDDGMSSAYRLAKVAGRVQEWKGWEYLSPKEVNYTNPDSPPRGKVADLESYINLTLFWVKLGNKTKAWDYRFRALQALSSKCGWWAFQEGGGEDLRHFATEVAECMEAYASM